jgi:hypothetical protein
MLRFVFVSPEMPPPPLSPWFKERLNMRAANAFLGSFAAAPDRNGPRGGGSGPGLMPTEGLSARTAEAAAVAEDATGASDAAVGPGPKPAVDAVGGVAVTIYASLGLNLNTGELWTERRPQMQWERERPALRVPENVRRFMEVVKERIGFDVLDDGGARAWFEKTAKSMQISDAEFNLVNRVSMHAGAAGAAPVAVPGLSTEDAGLGNGQGWFEEALRAAGQAEKQPLEDLFDFGASAEPAAVSAGAVS